ncbi:MAG: hypothetical protein EBR30_28565 [Cytophagia bacterium]|nr:hypothetical protein [Cytophagia bacterium]
MFAACLLAIYVSGSIGIDLLHFLVHDHHENEVSAVDHHQASLQLTTILDDNTIENHYEFHKTASASCDFSDVVFHAQQLLTHTSISTPVQHIIKFQFVHSVLLETSCLLEQQHLRGPPIA